MPHIALEHTFSVDQVMRRAVRWIPLLALATLLPYLLRWGAPPLPSWSELPAALGRSVAQTLLFFVVYLASAVLHELLHALAMILFARIPPRAIRFGVRWREGVAYVHAERPMSARAYRAVLLLPAIVQGVLPAVAAFVWGGGWIALYGFVMLASSVGDFAVAGLLRGVPPEARVRDHPSEVGFVVEG